MKEWLQQFFGLYDYSQDFFKFDENREYSNQEILEALRTEQLTLETGNAAVWVLLSRMNEKIEQLENVIRIGKNE